METTLILFSGLAGTGKSTLAKGLANYLHIPLFAFDYFTDYALPRHVMESPGNWTNDDLFHMMFSLAELQLSLGVNTILDAVFFGEEGRQIARAMAEKHRCQFRAIHTFCSDEAIWRDRVLQRRANALPYETPAHWEGILAERAQYQPWTSNTALFVDAINPIEDNLARVIAYILA